MYYLLLIMCVFRLIHNSCDSSISNSVFTCLTCREKSLMDGEVSDSVMPCVATENSVKFFSGGAGGLESDEDELDFVHSSPAVIRRQSKRNAGRRRVSPSNSTIFSAGCSTLVENNNGEPVIVSLNPGSQFNSDLLVDDDLFNGGNSSHSQGLLSNNADFFSGISSPADTTESTGGSLRDDSPAPNTHINENRKSDNDEYKPPTMCV